MLADRNMLRAACCDLAFTTNSSTLVIAAEPVTGSGKFVICDWIELKPEPGAPLKPSDVARVFAKCMRRHAIDLVMADLHYIESLRENLSPFRISVFPLAAGLEGKFQQFALTRTVLHEGRLTLPSDPRLIGQLKAVTSRANAGGTIAILQPKRRDGSHGDLCSSLVGSVSALELARMHPRRERSADETATLNYFFGFDE